MGQGGFKFLKDPGELIAAAKFSMAAEEMRDLLQGGEVFFDLFGDVGALNLYDDFPAVVQGGPMDLPKRSGGQRFRFEGGKGFVDPSTQLAFNDELDILEAEGLHLVLQALQGAEIARRQQIGAARQQLANFNKSGTQPFQVIGQLALRPSLILS